MGVWKKGYKTQFSCKHIKPPIFYFFFIFFSHGLCESFNPVHTNFFRFYFCLIFHDKDLKHALEWTFFKYFEFNQTCSTVKRFWQTKTQTDRHYHLPIIFIIVVAPGSFNIAGGVGLPIAGAILNQNRSRL